MIFSRPHEKNKLTIPFLREATRLFEDIHSETGQLRVITLESSDETIFAAGADMNELLNLDAVSAEEYSILGQNLMTLVETCPVPVISLVSGPCMGGGFDLAMSCRSIYATPKARFAHPGVYLGIITGFGGTVRLEEKAGTGPARQMILTGASISGEEAHKMGLVDELFPSFQTMSMAVRQTYQIMV
jgi:enoyl-CoA hydratase